STATRSPPSASSTTRAAGSAARRAVAGEPSPPTAPDPALGLTTIPTPSPTGSAGNEVTVRWARTDAGPLDATGHTRRVPRPVPSHPRGGGRRGDDAERRVLLQRAGGDPGRGRRPAERARRGAGQRAAEHGAAEEASRSHGRRP